MCSRFGYLRRHCAVVIGKTCVFMIWLCMDCIIYLYKALRKTCILTHKKFKGELSLLRSALTNTKYMLTLLHVHMNLVTVAVVVDWFNRWNDSYKHNSPGIQHRSTLSAYKGQIVSAMSSLQGDVDFYTPNFKQVNDLNLGHKYSYERLRKPCEQCFYNLLRTF